MYKLHTITESNRIPENFTGIVESSNGSKHWYSEGKIHRIDGPAIEYDNGTKYWYFEGKIHRIDGPAVEWANGEKYWWFEGKEVTKQEHKKLIAKRKLTCEYKIVEIDGKKFKLVSID